jgi:glycosyltransferase involved in cell wall biosynthesis
MTHILLVADRMTRPYRTGIDLYYDKLIYWLPRLAPQINFTVVSFGEPDVQLPNAAPNIRHIGLTTSRRNLYLRAFLPLSNPLSVLTESFDLVHVLMPLPILTDSPLLTTVYDVTPLLMPELYPWHTRQLFRRSVEHLKAVGSRFTTISQNTADDLARFFSIDKSRIFPVRLGVDDDFLIPDNLARQEEVRRKYKLPERYFFYAGSMHKRKNLPTVLDAYMLYKRINGNDTQLVIAGRMDLGGDELLKQIEQRGLKDGIILPGYLDADDLPFAIAGATALLYPSFYEGFGLPILEAMMCGTPVIAANTGAIPETANGHALLCDPLDVECFAQSMSTVNRNDSLKSKTILEARAWASQFTWRATVEQILKLYAQV